MQWYDDLCRYFPKEEMRKRAHFEWLIANRPDIYRVQANDQFVLLTLDYDDLTFIDYLYVYPDQRGSGIGTKLMRDLKAQQKAVLLEVEPIAEADPDTVKRRRFYDREGFVQAQSLSYRLPSAWTGAWTPLDLLCWAPGPIRDEQIYRWMAQAYGDLYAKIDPAIYGRPYPPLSESLRRVATSKSER